MHFLKGLHWATGTERSSPDWRFVGLWLPIADGIGELIAPVPVEMMPHLELKALSHGARGTIRTADTTPYANILIVSG